MLREARSLSLRAASKLARDRAIDSAGRVTHAYINQAENGGSVTMSLPKLLSLAAVYDTDVSDIIDRLPEPVRSRRSMELQDWLAAGRDIPERLRRLPTIQDRSDAELDGLFARRARGFEVHWEWKISCEREARHFLPFAILPPFIEGSPDLADEFWKLHPRRDFGRSWMAGKGRELALLAQSPWGTITNSFVEWATRETTPIIAAVGLLDWWTLDFTTSGGSCHFKAPDVEASYGFDCVPLAVVISVRRWQLARLLYPHGAPHDWPAPPAPIEGAIEFVDYLLRPQPFLPEHASDEPLKAADPLYHRCHAHRPCARPTRHAYWREHFDAGDRRLILESRH
jgi:transcriptional regulator with XRE-family HTH domain